MIDTRLVPAPARASATVRALFPSLVLLWACGGDPAMMMTTSPGQDSGSSVSPDLAVRAHADAGSPAIVDLASPPVATPDLTVPPTMGSDGTPMRSACTSSFGSGISATHGRLDGVLVAIVQPGTHGCSGDRDHIHLQVAMGGATYDVAITARDNGGASVFYTTHDTTLPDGGWSEGWHTSDGLDYVQLGLKASDFVATPELQLAQQVTDELKNANHISVFMTGYNTSGGHLVHRQGGGRDGAIAINPLSSPSHLLLFHFANQTF